MKLIKVYSKTCGPCKVLEDNLTLASITHESVDIDTPRGEEVVDKFNIRGVPTLLLLDDAGNEIKRNVGVLTVEGINKFINE